MKWKHTGKAILTGVACLLAASSLAACSGTVAAPKEEQEITQESAAVYHQLSAAEAKAAMDTEDDIIVVDVREEYEYNAGHIPDAVLLPLGSIQAQAAEVLPDKDQTILVYCRSGNRSRSAANMLVGLGYTQVYDFGGIIDWPYDVVQE